MSEAKHTPIPWHLVPDTLGNIEDENGLCVAQAQQTKPIHCAEDHAERMANAAFIVKACNSHEQLLEALKAALTRLKADRDFPPNGTEPGKALFDAIEHAEHAIAATEKPAQSEG